MGIKKNLVMASLAATAAFGGIKSVNAESSQKLPKEDKIVQSATQKSETRQKIAYLDEYVADIEAGKSKEEALKTLETKLSGGDSKKLAEIQKQVEKLRQDNNLAHTSSSIALGFILALSAAAAFRKNSGNDIKKYIHDEMAKQKKAR